MSINTSQCLWILDCLRDRRQVVRFNNITSHPLTTRAEVPRGCCSLAVSSPFSPAMAHTSAINLKRKLNSNINHGIQLIQLRKQSQATSTGELLPGCNPDDHYQLPSGLETSKQNRKENGLNCRHSIKDRAANSRHRTQCKHQAPPHKQSAPRMTRSARLNIFFSSSRRTETNFFPWAVQLNITQVWMCIMCEFCYSHPSVLGAIPPVQLCANKLDLEPGPDPACSFTSLITVLYFLREPNVDLSLTFSPRCNAGKIIWQLVYVSVGPVSLLECLFR